MDGNAGGGGVKFWESRGDPGSPICGGTQTPRKMGEKNLLIGHARGEGGEKGLRQTRSWRLKVRVKKDKRGGGKGMGG